MKSLSTPWRRVLAFRQQALIGLMAATLLSSAAPARAEVPDGERLDRLQGDYEVSVHPQPFGFFVEDGKLFLRMGGVEAGGPAVPLIEEEPGRFVISPGRRRGAPQSAAQVGRELTAPVRVPFVLAATHLIMARGGLNGRDGLTFFIDSGLASEAALAAPAPTLADLGIAQPETRVPESGVGGGGGRFATGQFPIERLALGALERTDLLGEFGPLEPASYWARGFIQDGLLSHRFLRRSASWTLDFDAMELLFDARPAADQ